MTFLCLSPKDIDFPLSSRAVRPLVIYLVWYINDSSSNILSLVSQNSRERVLLLLAEPLVMEALFNRAVFNENCAHLQFSFSKLQMCAVPVGCSCTRSFAPIYFHLPLYPFYTCHNIFCHCPQNLDIKPTICVVDVVSINNK